ncbi:DUF3795 domain-containing protein [Extibacter muris]|uniref:DUF3795 domain-containing protein n=1 Tax=Extibacter muris TaxID=1796622 RepID=A0A4R4FGI7_9FIRM|nr:DUF3795 domain-containing protein [Extibacter muris]MCU0080193.1 DUF3795 domain-containing protein [Extibacter muris]TDA22578.1 DUF3795 domain-containing protein [Extibacter muris]
MKGFNRKNQLFSLCGLNCGLCPMFLNKYCPGCGGGEGNQSCKIARCSMEHDGVEYCFQCSEYPCPKYEHIDDFDVFITSRNKKSDMEKAKRIGIDAYNAEQVEKTKILDMLLSGFNDGRKKTLFCTAVNLLDLQKLQEILRQIENRADLDTLTLKEKSTFAAELLKAAAAKNNIELKLRKKK